MIEVERKFLLTKPQRASILAAAVRLGQSSITDSYFDTAEYVLTRQKQWLRQRDGRFELKTPLKVDSNPLSSTNRRHELTDEDLIRQALGFSDALDFATALSSAGFLKYVTSTTDRKSYANGDLHIDDDFVTYEDTPFTYSLTEIELLVEHESEVDTAEQRILEFAKSHGLPVDVPVLGKIAAFLQAERPEHFAVMMSAKPDTNSK